MPTRRMGAVAVVAMSAAACGGGRAPETGEPAADDVVLAGTQWRLVEFQSSDDAIGVVRPEASATYTMTLGADGTASMQLDCNRASGTWQAADEDGGTFSFGPLAMTRAFCGPQSLDQQIGRHAEYVRSYVLRDGLLHLALMADGGIYVWGPM